MIEQTTKKTRGEHFHLYDLTRLLRKQWEARETHDKLQNKKNKHETSQTKRKGDNNVN